MNDNSIYKRIFNNNSSVKNDNDPKKVKIDNNNNSDNNILDKNNVLDNYHDKIIHKKTGKELGPGDHVKITIVNQKIFRGQDYIAVFAKMYDIATPQEINTYMYKDIGIDDEVIDDSNTIYEMNEDAGIEEGIVPTISNKRETFVQDV